MRKFNEFDNNNSNNNERFNWRDEIDYVLDKKKRGERLTLHELCVSGAYYDEINKENERRWIEYSAMKLKEIDEARKNENKQ